MYVGVFFNFFYWDTAVAVDNCLVDVAAVEQFFFFSGRAGAYVGLAHLALYLLEGKLCQPLSPVKNILEMLSIFSCVKHCYIVLITCSLYLLFPGSFATATCMICKHKVEAEAIRDEIMQQV